jgi:hypothetical protein
MASDAPIEMCTTALTHPLCQELAETVEEKEPLEKFELFPKLPTELRLKIVRASFISTVSHKSHTITL